MIGLGIKKQRIKHRLTQSELADILGVTQQAIHSWESNRTCPNIKILIQLSEIFVVTTDEIIFTQDDYLE